MIENKEKDVSAVRKKKVCQDTMEKLKEEVKKSKDEKNELEKKLRGKVKKSETASDRINEQLGEKNDMLNELGEKNKDL